MFDRTSQESQAHHHFIALGDEQHKDINNHELFGNAAAYHAANAYTDHVEKNGVPESQPEAEKLILGYAQEFVDSNIDDKGLKLEKDQAMKFATQSLQPAFEKGDHASWKVSHATIGRAFDEWTQSEKKDTYNNWGSGSINVYNGSRGGGGGACPNGDSNCGKGYICDRCYNGAVQPMGYAGVNRNCPPPPTCQPVYCRSWC